MITRSDVQIGKIYVVQHVRKGRFVGEVIALEEAPPGDEQDLFFVTMRLDVRRGTDQQRLAHANEAVAVKNIRPSLIISLTETEQANWLRTVQPQPGQAELAQQQQIEAMGQALRVALDQIEREKAMAIPAAPPVKTWRERLGLKH